MKTMKLSNFTRTILFAVVVLFTIFSLQSCARKMVFATSPVVPAAEGAVKLKKDRNNNYRIVLNVINLADPKRLDPPRNTYVVWAETEQNGTQNIGQLKTASGLLSKT